MEGCCWCSCRWGETMFLSCSRHRGYFSSPRWYKIIESHGGMILTEETEEFGERPAPVLLCPPHWLMRARIRFSATIGRRLTARTMARPAWKDECDCRHIWEDMFSEDFKFTALATAWRDWVKEESLGIAINRPMFGVGTSWMRVGHVTCWESSVLRRRRWQGK
jgi:hypothetical protein